MLYDSRVEAAAAVALDVSAGGNCFATRLVTARFKAISPRRISYVNFMGQQAIGDAATSLENTEPHLEKMGLAAQYRRLVAARARVWTRYSFQTFWMCVIASPDR
jgi:hypothetical protein